MSNSKKPRKKQPVVSKPVAATSKKTIHRGSKASSEQTPTRSATTHYKHRTGVWTWFVARARIISLLGGTTVVMLWTLIRHITNGVNFDVVGQIGLAQQWANGLMTGSQLGTTSYLLKMPFYFVVNRLTFISPMNRILILALLFNVATFVLLFVCFEKILKLYEVKRRSWFYLAMAWLATIAGGTFWMDYANSRNLETVGGIILLYLTLKFFKLSRMTTWLGLLVAASIVFFADPLQLYVCGVGIILFAIFRMVVKRQKANAIASLAVIGATIFGYIAAKGLFSLAGKLFHVAFLTAPSARPKLTVANILPTVRGLVASTFREFDAGFLKRPIGINTIREFLNAVVLLALVFIILRSIRRKPRPLALGVIATMVVINYFVYIASGQVLQWETGRYLVMVPLFVILLIGIRSDVLTQKYARKLQYAWAVIIIVSGIMLLGALAVSWPNRYAKDTHIVTTLSFLRQHNFKYALSSRGVGITTTYFSDGKTTVLPMACGANHTLYPTNLFYDNTAFKGLYSYGQDVPIILPAGGINFGKYTCSEADIAAQFGVPKNRYTIPGIGVAVVYDSGSLHVPAIDRLVGYTDLYKPPVIPRILSLGPYTPPSTLAPLPGCKGKTLETIVAHPDDDILFMNPTLQRQFSRGCVRTIYVTAADDGRSQDYWQGRERGIEAAYASMAGVDNAWTDTPGTLKGRPITARVLTQNPSIGLIFLRLPDGNVNGHGFSATGNTSLEQLFSGKIVSTQPVDGSPSFTYAGLIDTISSILNTDKPNMIFTHVPSGAMSQGDHSDHRMVGLLALLARSAAKSSAGVKTYVGYPDNRLESDLPPDVAVNKEGIFSIYAHQDGAICDPSDQCSIEETYQKYFSRSYYVDQNQHLRADN